MDCDRNVMDLSQATSRETAIECLEGYATERLDELEAAQTRRPLVKSYMLETVPSWLEQRPIEDVFSELGHELIPLDESMYKVRDGKSGRVIALLETILPRYPVLYTIEKSEEMDPWVSRAVRSTHHLDQLWLSGKVFEELLGTVVALTPGHRFGRLVFQSVSLFETTDREESDAEEEDSPTEPQPHEDDVLPASVALGDQYVPERRSTTFTVVDRLSVLKVTLPRLRDIYSPLHAISQLRFPSKGRGGHDFYFNGKVTNRSSSFAEHRQLIEYVLATYRRATEATESAAGLDLQPAEGADSVHGGLSVGSPVLFQFAEELAPDTFDAFVKSTFGRKRSRFRLWGNPIRLGPRKVHVYALDRHLWQPLFLEITTKQMVVMVPKGTCGNTVHRLVTNVQQYVDPGVDVWVGDRRYSQIVEESTRVDGNAR